MSPFIRKDEFVILMANTWPARLYSPDYLKRFREAGIETCWIPLAWREVERTFGERDWRIVDGDVQNALNADMKVLLLTPHTAADCFPKEWYLKDLGGGVWCDHTYHGYAYSELSPWNPDAMAYERDFQRTVIERYKSTGKLQITAGATGGAETLLFCYADTWFDDRAIASFRAYAEWRFGGDLRAFNLANHESYPTWEDVRPASLPTNETMGLHPTTVEWLRASLRPVMFDRQKLCASQDWREIWFSTSRRRGQRERRPNTGPRSCNWLAPEMYAEFPERLNASLNLLFFLVYYQNTTGGRLRDATPYLGSTWVGSQYAEGLKTNTQRSIDLGLRGFICGPLHPDGAHQTLEPWMLENIRWSLAEWRKARP